jgi:hypothetical protein
MNRNQLIELVKKIQSEEVKTQNEVIELVLLFEQNVPDPNASDYIFEKKYEYMTPEQIVDKALSYKPIIL